MGVADRWKDWEEPQQQGGVRFMAPRLTGAVRLLLIINVACFVLLLFVPMVFGASSEIWCLEVFGLCPEEWSAPYLPVWQFITYGFLHSTTDVFHLVWNMLLLYFFGTMLEEVLGPKRFMTAYMGGMVVGALLHCAAYSFGWGVSDLPVVGASGAVLGVVVACAVYRPNHTVLLFFIPLSLKVLVSCLVLFDIFYVIQASRGISDSSTAHWVHLGGAAFGFLSARQGWLQKDLFARFQAMLAIRAEEKRQDDAEVVDRLLEKISQEGLGSLSEKEKATLKRASERRKG